MKPKESDFKKAEVQFEGKSKKDEFIKVGKFYWCIHFGIALTQGLIQRFIGEPGRLVDGESGPPPTDLSGADFSP